MLNKIHRRFNFRTRMAIWEKVKAYVDRLKPKSDSLSELKDKYELEKLYRFDLGENAEGFTPIIKEYLSEYLQTSDYYKSLNEYPETTDRELCEKIGKKFGIEAKNVLIGTGSELFIDLISRALIEDNDFHITPSPTFFLFDECSSRCGGRLSILPLEQKNDYNWDKNLYTILESDIKTLIPKLKLIWLANPNNPTGQIMDLETIESIVKLADDHHVFVVVDEAYGEYMDTNQGVVSAASLLKKYQNLIVLRTFSKGYGLAGIRLGYLMTCSEMILRAISAHQNNFAVPQLSMQIASIALDDEEYVAKTRKLTAERMKTIKKKLNRLTSFLMIPSSTNVFMLKNKLITAKELNEAFESKGIMASPVFIEEKLEFLRITVRNEEDNEYFCKACAEIDGQINSMVLKTNNTKPNPPIEKEEDLLNFLEIMRILEEKECNA